MSEIEARLGLDWELWVVEHLLFTGKRDDLVGALVTHGIPAAEAEAQVQAIEGSPGFARLRARVAEGALATRLNRLSGALHAGGKVATEADISAERLLAEHWIPSRPIKLTDSAKRIGAVQRWSLDWLAAKLGDRRLTVNVKREQAATAKDTEKHHVEMSVAEFARRAQSEVGNALYVVSRNGVLSRPEFADLWADVTDLPAFLAPPEAPVGVSLWMGPAGTVTPPHFDPHNVLLVQVQGRKRVRLAPRLQAHQHDWLDGYYLDGDLDSRFGDGVLTVELGPGESLFVPVGWFHEVTALDPSMTLSFLCFPWPNHFHWLGPPGSDDARS